MEAEDGLNGPIGKYTGNMSIFWGLPVHIIINESNELQFSALLRKEKKRMTRSKDGKSPSHSYIIDINILSR